MWGINPSEWLHKLGSWDWARLDNVLSSIVGVTVLTSIAWATIKFAWNPLSELLSRRRTQAKVLDQLVCGSSVAFIESLLGVAQFVSSDDGREERVYRLRGGWVLIDVKDDAVVAFSITISNPRMHYRTRRLTFGFLKVKLGKSKFSVRDSEFSGERYSIGGRDFGYQRHYYFGNPGGYQDYWLSYNRCGAGVFSGPGREGGMFRVSGTLSSGSDGSSPLESGHAIDASGITVNTLTVLGLTGPRDYFLRRHRLGPEETNLRLAQNVKHPTHQTRRQVMHVKFELAKLRLRKVWRRAIKRE